MVWKETSTRNAPILRAVGPGSEPKALATDAGDGEDHAASARGVRRDEGREHQVRRGEGVAQAQGRAAEALR